MICAHLRPKRTFAIPRAVPARGRGGPRPGSACPERSRGGPPPGNLNAYKHGRTSRQHRRLLQLIARDPEAHQLLLDIARRNRRRQQQARREAVRLLDEIASRVRDRAIDDAADFYEIDRRIPPPAYSGAPPNDRYTEKRPYALSAAPVTTRRSAAAIRSLL